MGHGYPRLPSSSYLGQGLVSEYVGLCDETNPGCHCHLDLVLELQLDFLHGVLGDRDLRVERTEFFDFVVLVWHEIRCRDAA